MSHTLVALLFSLTLPHVHAESVPTIRFRYTADDLNVACRAAIDEADRKLKAIAALPADQRTVDNTLLAQEYALADAYRTLLPLTYVKDIGESAEVRNASEACETAVDEFVADTATRLDLFQAVTAQPGRDAIELRIHAATVREAARSGLLLDEAGREKFRTLLNEKNKIEQDFKTNLRKEQRYIAFAMEELAGVPPDFLKTLKTNKDGQVEVLIGDSAYVTIGRYAENEKTREKFFGAYMQRGGQTNLDLIDKTLPLRQQIAQMTGFANWADYQTAPKMAKSGEHVTHFLEGLRGKLAIANEKDRVALLAFKKQKDAEATDVKQWDMFYLENGLRQQVFNFDMEKVREYFPADVVVPGLLQVYSDLLGVDFREVKGADVWAPDVKLFSVHDKKDGRLIASFYMDIYQREGKQTTGAYCRPLRIGTKKPDGSYDLPMAVMVANLQPPLDGKPALLTHGPHGEVEILFHEFGHVMHDVLTKAPYLSVSSANLKQDFVEAPSQMLENWVWEPSVIARLSGHYLDQAQKLPADLAARLIDSRKFMQARQTTGQLAYALYDMRASTIKPPLDVVALYNRTYFEVTGGKVMAGAMVPAGFGHLMGGYDAGYYSYVWSKVFAQDLFTAFQEGGVLNPAVGARYRKYILEPGDSEDPEVLVEKFLGRPSNGDAFFRDLGVP